MGGQSVTTDRWIDVVVVRYAVGQLHAGRVLREVRAAAERKHFLKTQVDETKGNVTRTAEVLGLERSNLHRKMKALGIAPP